MVEFGFKYEDRQSVSLVVGTVNGTLLGPAPPQMSYEIVAITAVAYAGATLSGRLLQFATLQGYSAYGTTQGTIVESFAAVPGAGWIDGDGSAACAYVSPGNNLQAVVDAGSAVVKVVYRPTYKRGW
jgi:hypothetical protein